MKLGVRKLEYISVDGVEDFSFNAPGSTINLSSFIKSGYSLASVPFTGQTAEFNEEWSKEDAGMMSTVNFEASVRKDKDESRNLLNKLKGRRHIFLLTLISGVKYIIGSPSYVPTLLFNDSVSGISSSEFALRIENESPHGIYLAS